MIIGSAFPQRIPCFSLCAPGPQNEDQPPQIAFSITCHMPSKGLGSKRGSNSRRRKAGEGIWVQTMFSHHFDGAGMHGGGWRGTQEGIWRRRYLRAVPLQALAGGVAIEPPAKRFN